ncbi:MerR family transcriptional regulator [Frankia sp. AgB1.9]|uniref:MerR family transcriptional regulator n=1 Tax=unclassified Frankia TaxID=2632575 RepID=UPI0019342BB9|nr:MULTISPECIES: MerR family transcriptional regulator [unclassified Frankia]MBL7488932.1 MerR family transcriptional regulator [Frankia sp. AgW1.1]MBL7546721.1 MerR family transcriptional regulator [Frankia sp. AgB1.9]MBL7625331.1 MerR family transcriptional regulator [Frankia sp. AgB1.8]
MSSDQAETGTGLTVGQAARRAGITVRTLHHYDRIGLVRPSGRTTGGYRVYHGPDLERLRQVLVYRELGFTLDAVRALVDDPDVDMVAHLRRQRELLVERGARLAAMVTAIDNELEARAMGMRLTPDEQLEVFGTDQVGGAWADEAELRWGETDAYRQSQRRTAAYTKADWARMKVESDEGLRAFRDALRAGLPADGPAAMALAEQHRRFITDWFYDCDHTMHRSLGELYLADERFTRLYEDMAQGLAQYVRDAIAANADAQS